MYMWRVPVQQLEAIIKTGNMKNNNYAADQSKVSCMDIDYRLEAAQLNTISLISYSITAADCPCLQDSSRVPTWLKWEVNHVWPSCYPPENTRRAEYRASFVKMNPKSCHRPKHLERHHFLNWTQHYIWAKTRNNWQLHSILCIGL